MKLTRMYLGLLFLILFNFTFLFFYYYNNTSFGSFSTIKNPTINTYIPPGKIKENTIDGYTVIEIKDLITHEECDHIIKLANQKGYVDSEVYNDNAANNSKTGDLDKKYRLSKTCWIENKEDPLVEKIADISVYMTKIPRENQEALQVAKYDINGKFDSHYDCCVYNDKEKCRIMNGNAGERRSTLMIYLNDDFEGGETEFEKIGLKIKPEKGKAILFWSTDDNGKMIENSLHRGNKVTKGTKMICTKWSHMYKWENIPITK